MINIPPEPYSDYIQAFFCYAIEAEVLKCHPQQVDGSCHEFRCEKRGLNDCTIRLIRNPQNSLGNSLGPCIVV